MARPARKPTHHRHILPLRHHPRLKMRIGIMGGSFNPAHQGHLDISIAARKIAQLDEVWWIVSPQNPLKQRDDMALFSQRIDYARSLNLPRWIRVSEFEAHQSSTRTIDTLTHLRRAVRCCDLIWIMGADNLIQLPEWQQARQLMRLSAVMIMGRPGYNYQALASKGAAIARRNLRRKTASILGKTQRGWYFEHFTHNSLSATAIRKNKQLI